MAGFNLVGNDVQKRSEEIPVIKSGGAAADEVDHLHIYEGAAAMLAPDDGISRERRTKVQSGGGGVSGRQHAKNQVVLVSVVFSLVD